MKLLFDSVYYEPDSLDYPLGSYLKNKYSDLPWIEIENHNNILQFRQSENKDFTRLKKHLIIGIRKTHKYIENHKVSDFLVPYTSSGCYAMCLYCYLVCNYNKCSYLRVFVNREQIMDKLIKKANEEPDCHVFEIGSNSDLILENEVTGNLPWTIEQFASKAKGMLTFPTKFHMVEPILNLNHRQKVIFRMSVNPPELIRTIELGTSPLSKRIDAINAICECGYPVGILIAPIILIEDWESMYNELLEILSNKLSKRVKQKGFLELIFMTYSFVQNAINRDAFPLALQLYDKNKMIGRGKGKYRYREDLRKNAEEKIKEMISKYLSGMQIKYIS